MELFNKFPDIPYSLGYSPLPEGMPLLKAVQERWIEVSH